MLFWELLRSAICRTIRLRRSACSEKSAEPTGGLELGALGFRNLVIRHDNASPRSVVLLIQAHYCMSGCARAAEEIQHQGTLFVFDEIPNAI